jgi:hypothetical protein
MINLTRKFAVLGGVILLLSAAGLGYLQVDLAVERLKADTEHSNVMLARAMANGLSHDHAAVLALSANPSAAPWHMEAALRRLQAA